MDIRGKIIIITGASAGIGRAAAQTLAKAGAKVALVARSKEALDSLSKELPDSFVVVCDMSDTKAIASMIQEVKNHYGRIDVLINNAGQGMYGPLAEVSIDDYRRIWELNVVGPLVAMQQVIPIMKAQGGGTILNISSGVSKAAYPYLGAYASTKYALNAISLTARAELADDHIVVSLMHPGLTDTDFGKNAIKTGAVAQNMQSRNREGMPPADSPEYIAERIQQALISEEGEIYAHEK